MQFHGSVGGASLIRQALAAGYVDELTVIVAPVVLGAGKRLFDGFTPVTGPGAPLGPAVSVRHVHPLPREAAGLDTD